MAGLEAAPGTEALRKREIQFFCLLILCDAKYIATQSNNAEGNMPVNQTSQVSSPKRKVHSVLALLTIALGIALMTYMVLVEDEPGAIPMLLIAVGTGWYLWMRFRSRGRLSRRGHSE